MRKGSGFPSESRSLLMLLQPHLRADETVILV